MINLLIGAAVVCGLNFLLLVGLIVKVDGLKPRLDKKKKDDEDEWTDAGT